MVYVSKEVLHPFASVTVMLYAPDANELISWVFALKLFGPVHEYVYPATPPLTVISILPSAAPLQLTSCSKAVKLIAKGCVSS